MNTSMYSDTTLENAIVIMQHGVLDENLRWIPAHEQNLPEPTRRQRTSLVASGVAAVFTALVSALSTLTGTSASPF